MAQDFFIWGKNGQKMTPEQIARQREIEMELARGAIDTSPVAHPLQGLARVANALAGAVRRGRLDRAEADNNAYAAELRSRMFGSSFPDAPSSMPAPDVSAEISASSPSATAGPETTGLMGDFMAPIRESVTNPYGLAAVAATGRAESSFDPAKANARWSDPSQSGQPGTAGGIMSWRGPRLDALEAFARANGEDPSNISAATQGKFFLQEDPNLVAGLNNAKSLEEAQGLMDNAWKYAGYDQPSQERANRLASARNYLPTFQRTETASLDPAAGFRASAMPAPGQGNSEWLRYANEGAIRSQPISDKLSGALSFLPDMGVTMEVFSGGQPSAEEGGRRTGSTRHNHGGAADVFFYKNGRKLDWANPDDQPIFSEIVRRGRANGITGFGAGDGYMQPGSMHIGFGNPGVWGAGGKGANAADWLRTAYASADGMPPAAAAINAQMQPQNAPQLPPPVTAAPPTSLDQQMAQELAGGQSAPGGMTSDAYRKALADNIRARGGNPNAGILPVITGEQGQTDLGASGKRDALLEALSSSRVDEGTRRIADVLMKQEFEKQQAIQQEQAWRARKAYEAELQRNDPATQLEMRYKQAQLDALTGKKQKNWQRFNDTMLFDPETGETKPIGGGNPTGAFRFSGNSVEAQALNGLMESGQLTKDQAQQLAAGKQITNPADGSIIFMTPQGIFGQPANGGPAQPLNAPQGGDIDIFAGYPSSDRSAPGEQSAPSSGPSKSSLPPGAIQLTPGKAQMPTEATRNRAANVDQAFSTITGELDRYAQLVKDHGIEVAPGKARDNMNSVRQGIMLQLKELFNLGVLNGPDLGLMERMIYDPVVDVTKEGGITNLPSQLWDATTGAAEGRANNSVAELKRMLGNIKQSVDGSLAGQRSGDQPAPGGWQDVDGVKIRRK